MTMTEDAPRDHTWTHRPGMPNNPEFQFDTYALSGMTNGSVSYTSAQVLKMKDPIIIDPKLKQCQVCLKIVGTTGFGGHWRAHLVTIGAKPKVIPGKRGPNKKNLAKRKLATEDAFDGTAGAEKPKATEKLSVDDACIAVLMGLTGKKSMPIEKLPAVSAWIEHTKQLMKDM